MKRALIALIALALLAGAVLQASAAVAAYPPMPRPSATTVTADATDAVPASSVVYILGDSRMASAYLPASDGFTARLSTRMCGVDCNTPGHPVVVNAARGGQRLIGGDNPAIPDLSAEFPDILARTPKPTTAIVQIGINDFGRIDDGVWADAYRTLSAQAAAAGVTLLPCTVLPVATWFVTYDVVTPHVTAMNSWLRSYFGAPSCDMYAATVDPAGTWLPAWADNGDGIHPSPDGVAAMAAAVPLTRVR